MTYLETIHNGVGAWLYVNWPIVFVIVLALITVLVLRRHTTQQVLGFMLRAEKSAEEHGLISGPELFAWAVGAAYNVLPFWLRAVWPRTQFEKFAQNLYNKAKAEAEKLLAEQAATPPA